MPSELRAPTAKEQIGDWIRALFGGVSEQPLGRISDALGISDFRGLSEPRNPDEITLGIMPGPPSLKGFAKEAYPHTQRVRVRWPNDEMADDIKGLNQGHAVYRARENWPDANVTPVGPHYIDLSETIPSFELLESNMPVQDPIVPRIRYRR